MKILDWLIILAILILTNLNIGCVSAHTKTSEFCDKNWEKYGTWIECYNHEYTHNKNKGAQAFSMVMKGMSDGIKNSTQNSAQCTSYVYGNMVQTNCN